MTIMQMSADENDNENNNENMNDSDEEKCDYDKLYEGTRTKKRGDSESNMSLYVRSIKSTPDGLPQGGALMIPQMDPVSPTTIYSAMALDLPNTPIEDNDSPVAESGDRDKDVNIPTEEAIIGSLSDENLDGLYGRGGKTCGRDQFVE